jgi:hypothetical protein
MRISLVSRVEVGFANFFRGEFIDELIHKSWYWVLLIPTHKRT